jgi:hypothetical protein
MPLAANINMPKSHIYKIYNGTQYMGLLPNVTSEFSYSQDINTSGSQITIQLAKSADTSSLDANSPILDETGANILDESSNNMYADGTNDIVGVGTLSSALVRNGNRIVVVEYSYYYPSGKTMFNGTIEKWETEFGGDDSELITITCYSDGSDMDNHLVRGSPFTYTLDQSQTATDSDNGISTTVYGNNAKTWAWPGQTWTVGAGVTNLSSIVLKLRGVADVTVNIYQSVTSFTPIGSVTQSISTGLNPGDEQDFQFNLPIRIATVPGSVLYLEIQVGVNQTARIFYKSSGAYSGGAHYYNISIGVRDFGRVVDTSKDLYFKTYSSTGDTKASFSSTDPSYTMTPQIMSDYNREGGRIAYSLSNIDASGLSITCYLNLNTVYEALQYILTVLPKGFYYYVDLGQNMLYLKRASSSPDIVLTKGKHLSSIKIAATIEYVKNLEYFTGGATAGVNLLKAYQDPNSMSLYDPRLDRKSDGRVFVSATADAIGQSTIDADKDEKYVSVVRVIDRTMDITLLKPGMIVGFNGFGSFADSITTQIVRVDYTPNAANLTLGILPKRINTDFENTIRDLSISQNSSNPTAPS